MNNKGNQLKMGSFLSYAQMGLGVIIGLVYTPVMLRLLGQNEYGLYNTVASTISMLSILSLGFNSSYVRYFAKYKNEGDTEAIERLNGLILVVFSVIGLIALCCGLFLSNNLAIVFDKGLTEEEYRIARILMLLLTVNLAISFPMSVFQNIISANERFIFLKVVGLLKTVVSPLMTIPLLLMGYRSIAMVTVTVTISLVADICYVYYVLKPLNNRFKFHHFEPGLLKSMFIYSSFIALNILIDQINWNIDKMLLGRFKGTAIVSIYSIGFTLYSHYQSFSSAISGVFTPRIHNIYNRFKEDTVKLNRETTELFIKIGRIQFLILALIMSGLIIFGQSFIAMWAGEQYHDSYYVMLLLTVPATIPLIQNSGIEIQRAQNKHKFRSICYTVMALINLALSIVLCQKYGAIGSAVGTAISLIVANGIIMNIYYYRQCGVNTILFWKSIICQARGLIIPALMGGVIMVFFSMNSVWKLLAGISVYTLVYCLSMWLLGMNNDEKRLVSGIFAKLRRHKKT